MTPDTIFNKKQLAAIDLMQNDLRMMATLFIHRDDISTNYPCAFLPYMGLIVDGIEDWINRFNNSSSFQLNLPTFSDEEKYYYELMRGSIKFWSSYSSVYETLQKAYTESENHFAGLCKPIAKCLKLYDIFGTDWFGSNCCGNTIVYSCYFHSIFGADEGTTKKQLYNLSKIAGRYVALLNATQEYSVNLSVPTRMLDFGGILKSPVGNSFSDKFVLFSMLGQINYVIKFIDTVIDEETTSKLRFAYLLYFYLLGVLHEINDKLGTRFLMNEGLKSDLFRNAMAHYGIGAAIQNDSEFLEDDPLYGLAQKYLNTDYYSLRQSVFQELASLAYQLEAYLKIKGDRRNHA